MDGTTEEQNRQWTATYNKRKTDKTNRTKLGLKGEWPTDNRDEMTEFKRLCGEKGKADYLANTKETYTVIEDWCTVEGASKTVTG